jgi:hypothetical protein
VTALKQAKGLTACLSEGDGSNPIWVELPSRVKDFPGVILRDGKVFSRWHDNCYRAVSFLELNAIGLGEK